MKTTMPVSSLKVGMYIILKDDLNLFSSNCFKIENKEQIRKLLDSQIIEVTVDISKSFGAKKPEPEKKKLTQDELKEAMKKEAPEGKAKIIYNQSIEIMQSLMKRPTVKNICESKSEVVELVQHMVDNQDMFRYFIKINSHDYYTYTHSVNVGVFSTMLATVLYKGNSNHNIEELGAGFFLHDLGKVKVDDSIINKPSKLSDEEYQIMKNHPQWGYELLEEADELSTEAKIIVLQHHERVDGLGYPLGLKDDQIHDYGKITAIADVFDALTSKRSYKNGMPPFKALTIMKEEMLNHFEKDIFANFVKLFK